MLAAAVAFERFEAIGRRYHKIGKLCRSIQVLKLPQSDLRYRAEPRTRMTCYVKRSPTVNAFWERTNLS